MRPQFLPFLKYFLELRSQQRKSPESVRQAGQGLLERALGWAKDTKYYSGRMEGMPLRDITEDLSLLPPTPKEDVQANPGAFLRVGAVPDALLALKTSGTTGTPLELMVDQDALNHRVALKYAVETGFGLSPFDLFAEISHKAPEPHPLISRTGLFRRAALSVFDDERKNFAEIRRLRPRVLGWYPSAITVLAMLNARQGRPLRLKSVFCGSEMLSDNARAFISESFSCPVFNHYGAVEFAAIAWECPEEHSLHVNSTSCRVEIVDSKGKPKKSGTGDILITGLRNSAMPLIRYRIGDRGSWGRECGCGRGLPVLKTLEGRANDVLVLPSGKLRNPVSIDIMYGIPGIRAYQIVQEREDHFVFNYVPDGAGMPESSEKEVRERVARACLGERVRVEFCPLESIARGGSGKMRTVISKVKPAWRT
ncbi:MAG: AMP-binding protein [Candidatus Micrarchaeota archaeon]